MTRPRFYTGLAWFLALVGLGLYTQLRADVQAAREAEGRADSVKVVRDSVLGPEPLRAPAPRLLTDSMTCVRSEAFGWICSSYLREVEG